MSLIDLRVASVRPVTWVAVAAMLAAPGYAASTKATAAETMQKPVSAQQKSYPTPEGAVNDLIAAAKAGDTKALLAILGPDAKPIITSGDKVADRESGARFVKSYEETNKLEKFGDAKVVLNTGKENWPFPIPIIKEAGGWRFDTQAGQEEILNRRIGRNELSVMQVMLAYVDAQREYYLRNPQRDKLLQYAQKFASTQGRRDGLYWPEKKGEQLSPLGPLVARARAAGYSKGDSAPPRAYHGYYYRILKAQGSEAPGGAYEYIAQGKMIGGHALVAWPATYGNSGVMTLLVNHDGVVYEKDLGPQTSGEVRKITKFNPDKGWKKMSEVAKKPVPAKT